MTPPNSDLSPAARGFRMPAEWEPHEATWMAFPPRVYESATTLGDARRAWSEVAFAIAPFEPVNLLVRPTDVDVARELLSGAVTMTEVDLDDAWARDIGPTFVRDRDGTLLAVDWIFNGWGGQAWANWQRDDLVARVVADATGVDTFRSTLVNEGGGIEVDGEGLLLVTDTVQRDPHRNRDLSRLNVETACRDALGVERVVWLERGLTGDYDAFGTRGHVDLLAKFVAPGVAVVHDQQNRSHPDYVVSQEVMATLADANIEVIALRAPSTEWEGSRRCDWSYVNCYIINGAVVLGTYGDPADDEAISTLRTLFPQRTVVSVDARLLFALGGGVHCVTQQQPARTPCEK